MLTRHKDSFLLIVLMMLVGGSLCLAIIDPCFRPAFADLAKVGISGFLGWMMPRNEMQQIPQSSNSLLEHHTNAREHSIY
ncbi:MAG: hypothetical protein F6K36_22740 [Symploca sp. SIO3C6]|uniref:Uncharacterized protein n=1 Tax=Symploca sp. SIO1C4 TaxID=2607765 RepID=A0A6B3NEU7_9CYAN|nr:hypothetical protein [Symploca sp. SIO3C6]NER28181.1 hypothetical protein [Symploca sp. SIO1C4]NET08560.1 hypothetical protein [Symploca sp. SIO2B6]